MNPSICIGILSHRRYHPKAHAFVYGIYDVLLPIHDWQPARQGLLGIDRAHLLSVYARDYGPRDGSALYPWISALLAKEGVQGVTSIWLMTMPRVFGFAFNPVSFWFCTDKDNQLLAVLCEVNNTFGEHHNYLVMHESHQAIASDDLIKAKKVFHVSPFFNVEGHYCFRFAFSESRISVHIEYYDEQGLALTAHQTCTVKPMSWATQCQAFFGYPLVTFKVISTILWHGIRLWLKKIPIFSKPKPPEQETTR
jgi:hypothetical protein